MTNNANAARLRLKQSTGWFAADASFETALLVLSDGAFRLFAWICLKADPHTGRFHSTHRELSIALFRSRRAIAKYIAELEERKICRVRSATNQHDRTWFEVSEIYWPYERISTDQDRYADKDLKLYVGKIRDLYLSLGCGNGNFSAADERSAAELFKQGIAVSVVEDAILLGCARKYVSSVNDGERAGNGTCWTPIGSLAYFESLIEEVNHAPFSPDYRLYVRARAKAYLQHCTNRESGGKIESQPKLGAQNP